MPIIVRRSVAPKRIEKFLVTIRNSENSMVNVIVSGSELAPGETITTTSFVGDTIYAELAYVMDMYPFIEASGTGFSGGELTNEYINLKITSKPVEIVFYTWY